jgi:predicted dehydrogenase
MNRRNFISTLGLASAAAATGSKLFAENEKPRLKIGIIGCGWYGNRILSAFQRTGRGEVISLCDVNTVSLHSTLDAIAKYQTAVPRTFEDYRAMLSSAHHDVVIVATPNHWHALPAIAALQAGADLYLEKPISHDVIEGEAILAAARKYQRIVQVNTQRRSTPHFIEARDKYIRSGQLGRVGLVEMYCYLPGRLTEIVPDVPPPAHLNYDFWTGPAKLTPFKAVKENRGWRSFSEYSNGLSGDVGVHMFDATRWMLGLGWPTAIRSTGGIYVDKESSADITDTQRSVFSYNDLDVSWEHRTWGASPIPQRHWTDQWGMRIVGKNGSLNLTLTSYEFTPANGGPKEGFNMFSKTKNLENIVVDEKADVTLEAETRHCWDFVNAVEARSRPVADIEEGHISTACCNLGDIATTLGRTLHYDHATRVVVGDEAATKLLAPAYREPWVRPDPLKV